jgi:hypothetical protein
MTQDIRLSIQEQIDRVQANNVFLEESRYIKQTCLLLGCDNIIDFGSWCGVLAENILSQDIELQNYHLVDCVPLYMDIALDRLANYDQSITYELVTLLPKTTINLPQDILVNREDTLNTSSIYSQYFVKQSVKSDDYRVPIADPVIVDSYIRDNLGRFTDKTYVKIDLDGVDLPLVDSILDNQLTPGAIHFEVWHPFKHRSTKLFERLGKLGYSIPLADLTWHKNFSVSVGRSYWWAVGYDIIDGKYVYTYYDQDHGSQARTRS